MVFRGSFSFVGCQIDSGKLRETRSAGDSYKGEKRRAMLPVSHSLCSSFTGRVTCSRMKFPYSCQPLNLSCRFAFFSYRIFHYPFLSNVVCITLEITRHKSPIICLFPSQNHVLTLFSFSLLSDFVHLMMKSVSLTLWRLNLVDVALSDVLKMLSSM